VSDSILEKVVALVVEQAQLPAEVSIDEQTKLVGTGLAFDSLQILELSAAIEECFAIELLPDDLDQFQSIGTLAELVRCRLR